jgi:hypothetical protein
MQRLFVVGAEHVGFFDIEVIKTDGALRVLRELRYWHHKTEPSVEGQKQKLCSPLGASERLGFEPGRGHLGGFSFARMLRQRPWHLDE